MGLGRITFHQSGLLGTWKNNNPHQSGLFGTWKKKLPLWRVGAVKCHKGAIFPSQGLQPYFWENKSKDCEGAFKGSFSFPKENNLL